MQAESVLDAKIVLPHTYHMQHTSPMRTLPEWLDEIGKSQRWLAIECLVTDSAVSRWVSGEVTPPPLTRRVIEMLAGGEIAWGMK
jgi:hypothetical protein